MDVTEKTEQHQVAMAGQGAPGASPMPAHYDMPISSNISMEEYMFYAGIQRAHEKLYGSAGVAVEANAPAGYVTDGKHDGSEDSSSLKHGHGATKPSVNNIDASTFDQLDGLSELDKERSNAQRALKTAGWVGIFYLITTDILGPYGAPYAMSQNGWVTGNVMYIVMGFCAWWCGILLWKMFLSLDSARYPIKTYGDLGERVVGSWMRHLFHALQTVQLVINVGLICLTNGQALSQIISGAPGNHTLCFSVCVVIFALIGMAFAQVQTFKGLSFAATTAVYQNIAIVVISMAAMIKYGPYIAGAQASYGTDYPYNNQPVMTASFVSYPIAQKVNGIMNMVFAYGGAMIFPELMSEMRRPRDFYKSMVSAQLLICTVYLVYANVVYAYQGQYVLGQSYNGIAKYSFQTVCNVLAILSGTIAAALYGNVGLKVLYVNTVQNLFKGPALNSPRGRVIWAGVSVVYWALAFVIASSIPQVQTIAGLIAAVAIMNFSYSFPFMLALIYYIKTDAMEGDRPYQPGVSAQRQDTWSDWSRWRRGLFGGQYLFKLGSTHVSIPGILVKTVLLITCLGAYTLSGLGMYGSGESIKEVFDSTAAATSFGCAAPV